MIRRKRVDTFIERLFCNDCGSEMKSTGQYASDGPPKMEHQCPNCPNTEIVSGDPYPRLAYKEIEEESMGASPVPIQ